MMVRRDSSLLLRAMVVLGCLLVVSRAVVAQDALPVAIGQNAPGEVTATTSIVRFSLNVSASESATIQVLGFAEDFAPRFRVLNPADVTILDVSNPGSLATISGDVSFADAGNYTIEVEGENGTTGMFLLSLTAGAPLPAPVELDYGQAVEGSVHADTPVLVYRFSASATDALLLSVVSTLPDSGPAITLRDQTADRTLATSGGELTAVAYRIGVGTNTYRVEVLQGDGTSSVPFTICVEASSRGGCSIDLLPTAGSATPEAVPTVTQAASTNPNASSGASTGGCTVTSATGGGVNVRNGPGTDFGIIGSVVAGQSYPVVGQIAGGSWYQISVNGPVGWVAASVIQLQGSCGALPVVTAPAVPPAVPTTAPAATPIAPTTVAPPAPAVPTTAVPPAVPSGPTATDLPPLSNPGNAILDVELPKPDLSPGYMVVSVIDDDEIGVGFVVHNTGSADAGPFSIQICNRVGCATGSAGPIAAGGSFGSGVILPLDFEHVTGRLVFTVDTGNTVAESNEGNNVNEQTY